MEEKNDLNPSAATNTIKVEPLSDELQKRLLDLYSESEALNLVREIQTSIPKILKIYTQPDKTLSVWVDPDRYALFEILHNSPGALSEESMDRAIEDYRTYEQFFNVMKTCVMASEILSESHHTLDLLVNLMSMLTTKTSRVYNESTKRLLATLPNVSHSIRDVLTDVVTCCTIPIDDKGDVQIDYKDPYIKAMCICMAEFVKSTMPEKVLEQRAKHVFDTILTQAESHV